MLHVRLKSDHACTDRPVTDVDRDGRGAVTDVGTVIIHLLHARLKSDHACTDQPIMDVRTVDAMFEHSSIDSRRVYPGNPPSGGSGNISGDVGLVSAGRIDKDTPPLTTPGHTSKSSAMDISSHIF